MLARRNGSAMKSGVKVEVVTSLAPKSRSGSEANNAITIRLRETLAAVAQSNRELVEAIHVEKKAKTLH